MQAFINPTHKHSLQKQAIWKTELRQNRTSEPVFLLLDVQNWNCAHIWKKHEINNIWFLEIFDWSYGALRWVVRPRRYRSDACWHKSICNICMMSFGCSCNCWLELLLPISRLLAAIHLNIRTLYFTRLVRLIYLDAILKNRYAYHIFFFNFASTCVVTFQKTK